MSEPAPSNDLAEVERRVFAVLARCHDRPLSNLSTETTFDEMGLDSLDGVNLAFELEEEFDLDLPDEAVRQVTTLGEVIVNIHRLLSEGSVEA